MGAVCGKPKDNANYVPKKTGKVIKMPTKKALCTSQQEEYANRRQFARALIQKYPLNPSVMIIEPEDSSLNNDVFEAVDYCKELEKLFVSPNPDKFTEKQIYVGGTIVVRRNRKEADAEAKLIDRNLLPPDCFTESDDESVFEDEKENIEKVDEYGA